MEKLYERTDIYDLIESEKRTEVIRNDWKVFLGDRDIKTFLDVSIGTGSMTLALQELGIDIYGSDLSESMLEKCNIKAHKKGKPFETKCADFRNLSCWDGYMFDCVASTGNSLGYVSNDDVCKTLEEMDKHVNPGGYICFDSRNWEKIQKEKQRFYLYNPTFHDDVRVNLVQVWDHKEDGSITFNLLYTFEKENKIVQQEIFEEHYNPFSYELVKNKLEEMGYSSLQMLPVPYNFPERELEKIEWYRVIARKPE